MPTIKIAIVDDHSVVRDGLTFVISQYPDFELVMCASNGEDFLSKLNEAYPMPDVVLLDIGMPKMNGIECTERLKIEYPNLKIIILSMHEEHTYILHLVGLGVHSYLLKETASTELEKAVHKVLQNEYYFDSYVQGIIFKEAYKKRNIDKIKDDLSLTKREIEILHHLLNDFKNQDIAIKLGISVFTVETHRKNLLRKFEVHTTISLIVKAIKLGYIDIGTNL